MLCLPILVLPLPQAASQALHRLLRVWLHGGATRLVVVDGGLVGAPAVVAYLGGQYAEADGGGENYHGGADKREFARRVCAGPPTPHR